MASLWNLRSGKLDPYSPTRTIRQTPRLTRVSAPTFSIVSKQEMNNYLKVEENGDTDIIDHIIDTATSIVERECGGIAIVEQTWKQYQKGGCERITLMREPIIGTPTVSYYEEFETTVATNITYSSFFKTVENELYHVDGYWEEGRDGDGYTITFKAGLFTATDYTTTKNPDLDLLKIAICRIGAWLYEQREEHTTDINEGNWSIKYTNELPTGIKRLLQPFHTGRGLI